VIANNLKARFEFNERKVTVKVTKVPSGTVTILNQAAAAMSRGRKHFPSFTNQVGTVKQKNRAKQSDQPNVDLCSCVLNPQITHPSNISLEVFSPFDSEES